MLPVGLNESIVRSFKVELGQGIVATGILDGLHTSSHAALAWWSSGRWRQIVTLDSGACLHRTFIHGAIRVPVIQTCKIDSRLESKLLETLILVSIWTSGQVCYTFINDKSIFLRVNGRMPLLPTWSVSTPISLSNIKPTRRTRSNGIWYTMVLMQFLLFIHP